MTAASVLLLDFVNKAVRWITPDEANWRMREQEKRGVRFSASGSSPPRKEKP